MSLQASRYETADKTEFDEKVLLYYSLDARPLSAHEAPMGIVRINVDLFDRQGDPVTPNTVVLDLLDHPDGSLRIAKIRIEPGKVRPEGTPQNDRQWQMKFWQSEMGTFLKQSNKKDKQASSTASTSTSDSKTIAHNDQSKSNVKDAANPESSSEVDSTVGYIFSPYFAPASYSSSHRSHRHSHDRDSKNLSAFMRLIRPVILPAVLGAAAGLIACLVGFVIGHIFMSLSLRLGLRKERQGERRAHRRSKTVQIEDGIISEKAGLVPEILVTETEDSESEV